MSAKGTPVEPTIAELYPPTQPAPERQSPASSAAQRQAEARLAHDAADPTNRDKGNRHNGNGPGWYR